MPSSEALDDEITGSVQPSPEARVSVSELRLWSIAKTQRELAHIAREQRDLIAGQGRLLEGQGRVLDEVRGFLGRMVALEEAREARVSILRMAAERLFALAEHLSGPTELAALGVIVRWVGVTVVALAAILYGAQVAGWGWTIGFGSTVEAGLTAPAPSPAPATEIDPGAAL